MQRYTGELTPADNHPAVPMLFDGWGYVPLAMAPRAEQKDSEPDHSGPRHDNAVLRGGEIGL